MSVLFKPRWLALHLFTVVVVASCAGCTYWQFVRSNAGNGRSFGYALQWPAMGVFGLVVWAWLCRDGVRVARRGDVDADGGADAGEELREPVAVRRTPVPVIDREADPELAAYNDMLVRLNERASLHEKDGR